MSRRLRRKYRLYQDQCVWLDCCALAKQGLFAPGIHRARVESLSVECPEYWVRTEVVAVMHQDEGELHVDVDSGRPMSGMLTVNFPELVTLEVERVETPPAGYRWRFVCPGGRYDPPCGDLVRKLYLPETPPGIRPWWACRKCWGFLYRDYRREDRELGRDILADMTKLEHDVQVMKRIACSRLARDPRLERRSSFAIPALEDEDDFDET
jgi:hypothetical protein